MLMVNPLPFGSPGLPGAPMVSSLVTIDWSFVATVLLMASAAAGTLIGSALRRRYRTRTRRAVTELRRATA